MPLVALAALLAGLALGMSERTSFYLRHRFDQKVSCFDQKLEEC